MEHLRFVFVRILRLAATAVSGLPLTANAQTEMHFGAAHDTDNHHTSNLQIFTDEVTDPTSGEASLKVLAAATLFELTDNFGAVEDAKHEGDGNHVQSN